jgi:hypothetical protein
LKPRSSETTMSVMRGTVRADGFLATRYRLRRPWRTRGTEAAAVPLV